MPARLELSVRSDLPDLRRLLARLEPTRLQGALKNVGEAGVGLATEHIQDSTDPYGSNWAPLAESTLESWVGQGAGRRRRRSYGTKPLIRTGVFLRSLNWQLVGGDAVAIGTQQAAGVYHQGDPSRRSRGIVPRRMFLPEASRGLPPAWRDELVDAVESFLASGG